MRSATLLVVDPGQAYAMIRLDDIEDALRTTFVSVKVKRRSRDPIVQVMKTRKALASFVGKLEKLGIELCL